MKKKNVGRPVTRFTPAFLEKTRIAIIEYTDKTELPSVAECAYSLGIIREEMYAHEEFSYAIKRLITKKEFKLEERMLTGKSPVAACIFSLKQIGWKDRTELSTDPAAPITIKVVYDR